MPTITFSSLYKVNTSNLFSAQDLRDKFIVGFPDDFKCNSLVSDETIDFYIDAAKEELESYLGLILSRKVIEENKDYNIDDWHQWGFIKATYPVLAPVSIAGYLAGKKQIEYPLDWIINRTVNDGRTFAKEFRLLPVGSSVTYQNTSALYVGAFFPLIYWWKTNRNIPGYWHLKYITGFPGDKIPSDILKAIGMLATIPILGIISDAYLGSRGLGFGVASKSISIDGLSQSVSGFANGEKGIFGARMKQYSEQLLGVNGKGGLLEVLKDAYSSIIWGVC